MCAERPYLRLNFEAWKEVCFISRMRLLKALGLLGAEWTISSKLSVGTSKATNF
jgi:hypothetical protein